MKVSVLLLTFNEEANLPAVLRALSWCDDILVIDSGSTDRTVEIAENTGARVLFRKFDNFAGQRNWGLENGDFQHEWILHLDADEVVDEEFVHAINEFEPDTGVDAYNVPSKLMLFGRWLKNSVSYPTYQVRLGHRDRLRFVQVGHGQREDLPSHKVGTFSHPYFHYSFSHGMERWLSKHIRYARDEADYILHCREHPHETLSDSPTAKRRVAKSRAAKIPAILRPFARFLYTYLVKQGFRDGRGGLAYALMLSVYEGMTAIFIYERLFGGSSISRDVHSKDSEP